MKILIPASITYSNYSIRRKHRWKTKNKISEYKINSKRIVLRISSLGIGAKTNKFPINKRQVSVDFTKHKEWIANIKRVGGGMIMQSYPFSTFNKHPYIQIVVNKAAPKKLLSELKNELNKNRSVTLPIKVEIDMKEWKEVGLKPWDFLYHTETYAKNLMKYALNNKFGIYYIPKGREYDLQLINSNGKKFAIAISSHEATTKSRSKQHRVQKALIDIAKLLPSLHKDRKLIPVIIMQPTEFKNSWSFSSSKYLEFYRKEYGFKFIFTNFNKGWESKICKELKRL